MRRSVTNTEAIAPDQYRVGALKLHPGSTRVREPDRLHIKGRGCCELLAGTCVQPNIWKQLVVLSVLTLAIGEAGESSEPALVCGARVSTEAVGESSVQTVRVVPTRLP